MHISDIKKLKDFGNYQVDHQLGMLSETIGKYIAEYGLQLNPDFQRGHVWTEQQQTAFVEFILKGGKSNPILLNQPDWMKGFRGDFVCVDGLQRLTALLKFLDNKLPVFNGNYLKDIGGIEVTLRGITVKFYINELKTKKEVLEWYLELNAAGTVHTKDELEKVQEMIKTL